MKLYRIASAGPTWAPDDLTGTGAASAPGRWNLSGEYVVYAAPSLAMAVLETTAHVRSTNFPLDRYVVEIDVPDSAWDNRTVPTLTGLPGAWDAIPHAHPSIAFGSAWYTSARTALIELPSAIVFEESTVLINCTHPEVKGKMRAEIKRKFHYSQVLRS